MRITWVAKIGLAVVAATSGCAALSGIKAGQSAVSDTTGTVKSAEGQGQGLKQDVDTHKDMVKGGKNGKGGGGGAGGGDPDGDGKRSQAQEGKPNEPITDNLDPGRGDSIDWRFFALGGKPGRVTVEIHWDDENAILNLDVYDSLGASIASQRGREGAQALRAIAQLDQPQRIYVKISSAKGGTDYTFITKWAGGPAGGAAVAGAAAHPAANEVPNPAGASAGGPPPGAPAAPGVPGAAAPAGPVAPPADDPNHPRARIVNSYRDGNDLILYLDKGSAANIKAGMTGAIIDAQGVLVDGGAIRVTKVVDATKSIAKASITKIGKNTNVVINLVK